MKKINIALIFTLLLLAACQKEPKEKITKGDFEIQLLFEHDGCKVYRFKDFDKWVYYTTCETKK